MNVIFLDIDGVFNHDLWFKKRIKQKDTFKEEINRSYFDPRCVELFNNLIKNINNVGVVLSSTWRYSYDTADKAQELLKSVGIECNVVGVTPVFHFSYGNESITMSRGSEIKYWLDNNDYNRYAIIDDDADMLLEQANSFFKTDFYCGLTSNICHRITNHFNEK